MLVNFVITMSVGFLRSDTVIEVTQSAIEAFKQKLSERGTPQAKIRLGVKGGGCAGFSFVISYDDSELKPSDKTWVQDDVSFVVDPKSLTILTGSIVSWNNTLTSKGFDIVNPRETSRCGCGRSFSVR